MYTNEVLFRKWMEGLESGCIKGIPPCKPSKIGKLLTIAGEAHIRLELWLALTKRNFRHSPAIEDQVDRKRKWKDLARLVSKDRQKNLDAAHKLRMSKLPASASGGGAEIVRDNSPLPEDFYM